MKQISFILLFLFSLKSSAQNVFFRDTLRFDSAVICKLLYGKNPTKKSFIFSTFRDTIILYEKDKKKIENIFNKREMTQKDPITDSVFDNREIFAFDYIKPSVLKFRVYVNSDDMWTAATFPDFHHHRTTHVYNSPGFYKYLLKKRRREERQNRKKDKK